MASDKPAKVTGKSKKEAAAADEAAPKAKKAKKEAAAGGNDKGEAKKDATAEEKGKKGGHKSAAEAKELDMGAHIGLDSIEEVEAFVATHATVFVSHQWLGDREPDAANVHFDAVVEALTQLCDAHDIGHDELYVWLE